MIDFFVSWMTPLAIISALIAVVWYMVMLMHYWGWRSYDREFGTDYRFNEGQAYIEEPNWFDRTTMVPRHMERLLRWIEKKRPLGTEL